MTALDWSRIPDGTSFEQLMQALVGASDPKARLFGRPGADGAQDAVSGDRTVVYQAKYRKDAKFSQVLNLAKKESRKIERYKEPSSSWNDHWQGATHWTLVTNAEINPNDREKWDTEVVPLFERIDLRADFWDAAKLREKLARWPHIQRHYFGGENRVFLSLLEANANFIRRATHATGGSLDSLVALQGREHEIAELSSFIQDASQKLLVVHGPPGIGISRLLLEAGNIAAENRHSVLWGNALAMDASSAWFGDIGTELSTVLIIDGLPSPSVLPRVYEQLESRGRTATDWKVIVGTQDQPAQLQSPLVRYLDVKCIRNVRVGPLSQESAEKLALDWLSASVRPPGNAQVAAEAAASIADGSPQWLALASMDLLSGRSLNKLRSPDRKEIARSHIDRTCIAVANHPQEVVQEVYRWVALMQPMVSLEHEKLARVALEVSTRFPREPFTPEDLRQICEALEERGAIEFTGDARHMRLTSAILRDHLLRAWFVEPPAECTRWLRRMQASLYDQIVAQRAIDAVAGAQLVAMARVARILQLEGLSVAMLGGLWDHLRTLLGAAEQPTDAARLLQELVNLAPFYPAEFLELLQWLREEVLDRLIDANPESAERLYAAMAALHTATSEGAEQSIERKGILKELLALALHQAKAQPTADRCIGITGYDRCEQELNRANEGAATIRAITCMGGFWRPSFDRESFDLACSLIPRIVSTSDEAQRLDVYVCVLCGAASIFRQATRLDGLTVTQLTGIACEGDAQWNRWTQVRIQVLDALASRAAHEEARIALWSALHGLHSDHALFTQPVRAPALIALRNDLIRVSEILSLPDTGGSEFEAARLLWAVHAGPRAPDSPVSTVARELEAFYLQSIADDEARKLFATSIPMSGAAVQTCASMLLEASRTRETLQKFFIDATAAANNKEHEQRLLRLARTLGSIDGTDVRVIDLAAAGFEQETGTQRWLQSTNIVHGRLDNLRNVCPEQVVPWLKQWCAVCRDDDARRSLLTALYEVLPSHQQVSGTTIDEARWILDQAPLFGAPEHYTMFVNCSRWIIHHDWNALRECWDGIVEDAASTDEVAHRRTLQALQSALYRFSNTSSDTRVDSPTSPLPHEWLADLLAQVGAPYLSDADRNDLEEIFNRLGRLSLGWLAKTLTSGQTRELESAKGGPSRNAINFQCLPCDWVQPVGHCASPSKNDQDAISTIFALRNRPGSVREHLPTILLRIDPRAKVVRDLIAAAPPAYDELNSKPYEVELVERARIVGAYFNLSDWHELVLPILNQLDDPMLKGRVFEALYDNGPGRLDEVPRIREDGAFWTAADCVGDLRNRMDVASDQRIKEFLCHALSAKEAEAAYFKKKLPLAQ